MATTSAIRRRQPAPEQESYFVSMTDLMIGLLFIFIIMLMSFALNYGKGSAQLERQLREARDREQKALVAQLEAERRADELEAINKRLTDNRSSLAYILGDIQRSLKAQGIQVRVFPETGILRLPESILFESGEAQLSARGRDAVQALGQALAGVLPCFAASRSAPPPEDVLLHRCPTDRFGRLEAVLIEGHTDNRSIASGRFKSNWDLSAARAITTFGALAQVDGGLADLTNDRHDRLVGVSGYGEFRPVESNLADDGRRANRRIDLRFLMAAPQRSDVKP